MTIKRNSVIGVVVAMVAILASSAASADGRRHRHSGPRVAIAIGVGVPFYRPYVWPGPYLYYHSPAPYYAYPPVVIQSAPQVYVEQAPAPLAQAPVAPQAQPANPGDWYFCAPSRAYYPYVGECAEPWQRVPAQPPANSAPR